MFFMFFLFKRLIRIQSFHHQVEIDLVPVEFGPVNANELGFSVIFDSAAAAHAGAVNHNCIE